MEMKLVEDNMIVDPSSEENTVHADEQYNAQQSYERMRSNFIVNDDDFDLSD
eukprot:Pgem_evm1s16933